MKIYCSGIGGMGLSAYAALRAAEGHSVSGSDRSGGAMTALLTKQGIPVFSEQDGSHIPEDADLFVYSEAIPADAPERLRARDLQIPVQSYFQALGEMTKDAFVVAVCGTHGKSSTTAMAAKVLADAGKDPSMIVGTTVPDMEGRNWRKGRDAFFVLEACEYRRSFHELSPDIVLMTNVDGDHFDAYPTLASYQDAFAVFLKRLPEHGTVITHGNDQDAMRLARQSGRKVIDADALPLPELSIPGTHMRQNAQLVSALGKHLGLDASGVLQSLHSFRGTARRMEHKGELSGGITVIDDYAHHPVEIAATLEAMRAAYRDRRIVIVFQPHTHDRTLQFYDAFTKAFAGAALVIIPNVYNARSDIEHAEVDLPAFIADIARGSQTTCIGGGGLLEAERLLRGRMQPQDLVVTMGAGDITTLAERLMKRQE